MGQRRTQGVVLVSKQPLWGKKRERGIEKRQKKRKKKRKREDRIPIRGMKQVNFETFQRPLLQGPKPQEA